MHIVTTRFGLIQAAESDLIRMPDGLVGFRSQTLFIQSARPRGRRSVVAAKSPRLPSWLSGWCAPPMAIGDYRIELRPGDRASLELDDERSALVYVILNRGDSGGLTVNLQGPLVFNPARRLGRQLVLDLQPVSRSGIH